MATPKFLGIKETCLYPKDLHRTREFYEGRLGLKCFSFAEGRHAFFRAGTAVLLCFNPENSQAKTGLPRHFGSGELHFAFEIERGEAFDQWVAHLKKEGVEIDHEEIWPGGYRSVYFRDPDRHCVEIIEAGMWEWEG